MAWSPFSFLTLTVCFFGNFHSARFSLGLAISRIIYRLDMHVVHTTITTKC